MISTSNSKLKIKSLTNYISLAFLFLISIICTFKSAPCNSFPKIFGGSVADTGLYHIDIYNDYLALVGNTWDS